VKISLGLLEVKGLALAINSADVMAKCAAINIIDIEKTNGNGWMLIKISGDVASVQAAILSGASLADKNNGLISHRVLPRPDLTLLKTIMPEPKIVPYRTSEEHATPSEKVTDSASLTIEQQIIATCNLCFDPLCPRHKGDPHSKCINGDKQNG